jgi:hypothetical protein
MNNQIKDKATEIVNKYGLDFTITKEPLFGNAGKQTPYFGLFNSKTNDCINTCKEGYTVSQNREVIEMVLAGIEPFGSKLSVSKAGSLNGGRKTFMQLAIEGDSKVANDVIKRFVTVIDSNDGSTGLSIGIGDLTMSCSNQFFKFYAKGNAKFRHTATIEQKIKTIPSLIELALSESLRQIIIYNTFASTPITRELAHKMVNHILGHDRTSMVQPTGKALSHMDSLYKNIDTEINGKGLNLWGLHSGVTRWTTHEKGAPKRDNGRIESAMVSTNYNTNILSLEFATANAGLIEA